MRTLLKVYINLSRGDGSALGSDVSPDGICDSADSQNEGKLCVATLKSPRLCSQLKSAAR